MENYRGKENLEVMEQAYVYNEFLINTIKKEMHEAHEIVDFGAGNGFFAQELELRTGKKIVCVEPAANMQKECSKKGLTVLNSLAEIPDNSLDFIYTLNVLEHIEEDRKAISEMCDKLKTGGRIFVYVPAFQYLYSAMDKKVGHFRRYSYENLCRLFCGKWKIERIEYVDFAGYFASLLFKYAGSKKGDINPLMLRIYDKFVFPASRFMDKITGGKVLGKNLLLIAEKK